MKKKEYNKILGDLEAEIMEVLWKMDGASVRDVLNMIKRKTKPAYTTVMTVMTRLCNKKLLKRKLNNNNLYIYTPAQDKQTFFTSASKNIINDLIKEFGEVAVVQFIDIVESSNKENLKEWKRKLSKLK